jgi:hypothetical protein
LTIGDSQLGFGVSDLDRKKFPPVAVGVGDPYFILQGKAAVHIHFIHSHKSCVSESLFGRQDLGGVLDFYAKVIEHALVHDLATAV